MHTAETMRLMLMRCWEELGGRGGKNSSESDTQGPARWAKVPLSLSRQKWMEHAKVCVLQNAKTFANEKTFRNGIEQERPAPSRRWEVNIWSWVEIEVDLLFIYTNIWSWVEPSSWLGQKLRIKSWCVNFTLNWAAWNGFHGRFTKSNEFFITRIYEVEVGKT